MAELGALIFCVVWIEGLLISNGISLNVKHIEGQENEK